MTSITKHTVMYCTSYQDGYRNFYGSVRQVTMCLTGPDDKTPIYSVDVTEDDANGTMWAWWDAQRSSFSMVYKTRQVLEICFPYGIDVEEKRDRGKACKVSITAIERVQ